MGGPRRVAAYDADAATMLGSDQMAIQRYLATRDAQAARRVLHTTLIANVVIALVLAAIGLALLAFRQEGDCQRARDLLALLPDAKDLYDEASVKYALGEVI